MLIKSVELKNIKSYRHATIEFGEGINGVCGQNGHGKTTILEAIGYVLFDFLPYREDDFKRRGESSGYVSVEVLVNNVPYTLTRKLGGEYSIRGGNIQITGKKNALAWLVKNVFLASTEEELPGIFENAVGVPQGMLTASFMETPTKRRKTFDEILKVDEYRNAYENLRSTMNLIDESVRSIENDIDKLRIRTENFEKKKEEKEDLARNMESLKKALKECIENLNTAKNMRDSLKMQKEELEKLENEFKQGRIKMDGLRQMLQRTADELKKAHEAANIVSGLSGDKDRYIEERKKLERLEIMRKERDSLKDRVNRLENEFSLLNEKRTRLVSLKSDIDRFAREKTALVPLVEKQTEFEKLVEGKKGERAIALNEIKDIKNRMKMAGAENFCPVIKGIKCSSVEDFSSYFRKELADLQGKLEVVENDLKTLDSELNALGDPRSKVNTLSLLIKKGKEDIEKNIMDVEKIPEKENFIGELKKELDKYASIDNDIGDMKKIILELEPVYQRYMQNLQLASRFKEFKNDCERLEKTIADDDAKLGALQERYDETSANYKPEALEIAERTRTELGAKVRGLEVELKEKGIQLQRLDKEIAEMKTYLSMIGELESKLENEKKFREYAKFIRETLRDSAQHIVLELIGEISEEANSLYCSIMDDFSQELCWSEDYGIVITESGEGKNFQQLSGGEKMGAALSVRLALLKLLSNSDFVFLDEPTQNMDEIRRGNLSEQIMNIRGFKQIFVISHDDTFNEKYAHVVKIEKIDGESRVVSCST